MPSFCKWVNKNTVNVVQNITTIKLFITVLLVWLNVIYSRQVECVSPRKVTLWSQNIDSGRVCSCLQVKLNKETCVHVFLQAEKYSSANLMLSRLFPRNGIWRSVVKWCGKTCISCETYKSISRASSEEKLPRKLKVFISYRSAL